MKIKNKLYPAKKFCNLREVLNNTVQYYPKNNAFIVKEKEGEKISYRTITYKMFQDEINFLGTALLKRGLLGKKIAIISPNRYEWCVSYLAVVNGLGIVVPLDKGLPEEEIETSLKRSKVEAVIFDGKYYDIMKSIKQKGTTSILQYICLDKLDENFDTYFSLLQYGKEEVEKGVKEYKQLPIDSDKMSILLFTSGTTSASKAVMLSHRNIAENIFALNSMIKVYSTDISLAFLPLHHTFGATGYLFFMANGATTVFCDGLRHIQENLKEYKVSVFVCVPLLLEAMYKKINVAIEKQGKTKLIKVARKVSQLLLKCKIDIRRKLFKQVIDQLGGNLRLVVSGAAAIEKEVAKGFNEFGITTIQGYGLTETAPVLTAENEECISYGSVGVPLCNVDVKIEKPDEKGIGEIKAKGPNVMLGYYENEEATKEVLKNGWFYTGDLGYLDSNGVLYITGRKKNMIVLKNGKKIFPEEVELVIGKLDYVLENMVFGYPKGDDVILSVKIVYNEEIVKEKYQDKTKDEFKQKVWEDIKKINQMMPNYKHIKKMILTDEPMIKTTTQKIKRFAEIEKIGKQ